MRDHDRRLAASASKDLERHRPLWYMSATVEAIEAVYRRRYVGYRNALATVTGSQDSARDAVQEAFARALAHRRQFRGGSLEAWIWRIALRAALASRRAPAEVPLETQLNLDMLISPALIDPERDPQLAQAIRSLPPRRRLIVFLRYFADLDYAQIASATGVAAGTVAAALAQANASLAQTLPREGVGDEHRRQSP